MATRTKLKFTTIWALHYSRRQKCTKIKLMKLLFINVLYICYNHRVSVSNSLYIQTSDPTFIQGSRLELIDVHTHCWNVEKTKSLRTSKCSNGEHGRLDYWEQCPKSKAATVRDVSRMGPRETNPLNVGYVPPIFLGIPTLVPYSHSYTVKYSLPNNRANMFI